MKNRISLGVLLFMTLTTNAQDATFSQFNAVPLVFNPGYTGSAEKPRLSTAYRMIRSKIDFGRYQTVATNQISCISYDQPVKRLHGALGMVIWNNDVNFSDRNNSSRFNTLYCGLTYAAKFKVFNKVIFSPAVKLAFRSDYSGYTFNSNHGRSAHYNADLGLGVVFNTKKFHLGLAFDHLNRPATSFDKLNDYDRVPIYFIGQLGYTFQKNSNPDLSVTPSLMYKSAVNSSFLQANIAFRYKWATFGVAYGEVGFTNIMVGYYSKKVIVGYSFGSRDLDKSMSGYDKYYAHEISLRYFFKEKQTESHKNKE